MDTEITSCPICFSCYDQTTKKPRLTSCGHLFCSECISKILSEGNNCFKCPVDRQIIPYTTLDSFPEVFALTQAAEKKRAEEECEKHNMKKIYVCLQDKVKMCQKCLQPDHLSHPWISLQEFCSESNGNVSTLKRLTETYDDYETKTYEEVCKLLESKKMSLQKEINLKFNPLLDELNKKKSIALQEVSDQIEAEYIFILSKLSKHRVLIDDISEKIKKWVNSQDLDAVIEINKTYSGLKESIEKILSEKSTKEVESAMEDLTLTFQETKIPEIIENFCMVNKSKKTLKHDTDIQEKSLLLKKKLEKSKLLNIVFVPFYRYPDGSITCKDSHTIQLETTCKINDLYDKIKKTYNQKNRYEVSDIRLWMLDSQTTITNLENSSHMKIRNKDYNFWVFPGKYISRMKKGLVAELSNNFQKELIIAECPDSSNWFFRASEFQKCDSCCRHFDSVNYCDCRKMKYCCDTCKTKVWKAHRCHV